MLTGFSPLVILSSFPSVPSFHINNYEPLLLISLLLDICTALILVAGLALGQQSRFSTIFSICSPSTTPEIQTVVPALAGLVHQMSAQHAQCQFNTHDVTNCKAISFPVNQSYSVIPLFRYSVIAYSTFYSVPL